MLGLFEQPFKINHQFNDKSSFEQLMLDKFNMPLKQSSVLYEAHFMDHVQFTYHDIEAFFDSTANYHTFLANPLIVDVQ